MEKKIFNRIRIMSGILCLTLFVFYYSGMTFFSRAHTHEQSSIVHSHPYGTTNHTHTNAEFILISGLHHLLDTALVSAVAFIALATILCCEIETYAITSEHLGAFKELFNLRPPPFLPVL